MAKKHVAIAMAVWLTWAAFLAPPANALPNHIVAGGVYPMGAGAGNPANAANLWFYSTSQPSFAILSPADSYTPADATNPALFAKDVGASWNWNDGDTVMAVAETLRGVSGWTGVNYTASRLDTLRVGPTTQDIGDMTVVAYPTLARTFGVDWINVAWTGLADTNIVSYNVYRSPGPMVPVGTVNQGGALSFNNTGLSAGSYCYVISVNYRRDLATGVYETTGRSESVCGAVTGTSPWIVTTSPADAAGNVAVTAPIVVTFSEAMNTGTLLWTISGGVTLTPAWTVGNTVVTLSHAAAFTTCTVYQVNILPATSDTDGNNLIGGPVPNPWSFTTTCPAPYITLTSPADLATQVPRSTPVAITFSEAMLTTSVVVTPSPPIAWTTQVWSGANTILTLTHTTLFAGGTRYMISVQGTDIDGNSLIPGPAPNPWNFTANTLPTTSITSPALAECRTGGTALTITWTMSDGTETPASNLRIWLNYTFQGGAETGIPGVQGITYTPPYTYSWPSIPAGDGPLVIFIAVMDGAGEVERAFSATVTVDNIRPTVSSMLPTATTGVATNQNVRLTFSEAMDTTATSAAVSISPDPGVTKSWFVGDTVLWLNHTTAFQPNTAYTVTVAVSCSDACTPGLGLAAVFTGTFTTGAGARVPNAPTNLVAPSATASAIALQWSAPTTWTDGTALQVSDLRQYVIERATAAGGPWNQVGTVDSPATSWPDSNVVAGTLYYYRVKVVDVSDGESDWSNVLDVRAGAPPTEPFNWLLVIIPLIVILVIVGLFLIMRKKKPEVAPPTKAPAAEEEAVAEEPAAEEIAEEPATAEAKEESGEKFVPCPNCGTMVKPTDAECFVCGAKL